MKKILFFSFFLLFSSLVLAQPLTSRSFLEALVPISEPFYVPINEIFPAQLRYASQNVQEKINKTVKKEDAVWREDEECWIYRYDQGRSIFSMNEAIPVVKAPFGYVATDGHHDILSSLALGATWIPIQPVADLSELSEDEFWKEAERLGLAYLYDIQGQRQTPPRDFHLLEDDPNRYFAVISGRKCVIDGDFNNCVGPEYPLWIKVGKDIPFIEFKIADVLWQNHLIYQYEMGRYPPESFMEAARQALVAANIPDLWIVTERKHYSELTDEWKNFCARHK